MAFSWLHLSIWLIVTLLFGQVTAQTFCPLGIYRIFVPFCRTRGRVKPPFTIIVLCLTLHCATFRCVYVVLSIFLGIFSGDIIFLILMASSDALANVVRPVGMRS